MIKTNLNLIKKEVKAIRYNKKKKGSTLTNIALTTGPLVVGLIAFLAIRKITYQQAKSVEEEVLSAVVKEIITSSDKANAFPTGARYKIRLPIAEEFNAEIKKNIITLNFTKRGVVISREIILPKVYIIPSKFSTSGEIYVYKDNNNLLVTNELICNTNDEICDNGCIIKKICDSKCYSEERDGICNMYCLDSNRDGFVDYKDSDGICDPDCYTNEYKFVYDYDCLQ
jgi:hypothetical protein